MSLSIPCAYQGGKQRIASQIVDEITASSGVDDRTVFYDLCCGSGAVSIELVRRGVSPERITMVDAGPWGAFWQAIGDGTFDMRAFQRVIDDVPTDVKAIQEHVKTLSRQPAHVDTHYVYLVLQATAFGSKAIWIEDDRWMNCTFRNYWEPTETSSRRSPVNPMMPMPGTLVRRVEALAEGMRGVTGIHGDVRTVDVGANAVVYVDPPYLGTTAYGHALDVTAFARTLRCRTLVSEGVPLTNTYVKIAGGRSKGGISGARTNQHEEYLSIFEGHVA